MDEPKKLSVSLAGLLAQRVTATCEGVVNATAVNALTLAVGVAPETLHDWEVWLNLFNVPVGSVTFRGSYATAKGNFGRVRVLLTGHGVSSLSVAQRGTYAQNQPETGEES